jgi:unsaturated rhamnogalacturonyl hydrolase
MHLKEVSALEVKSPAVTVATNGTLPVIAKATIGKGKVMVVGDPWLYNEYLDGRKLPKQYQNFQAAQELVNWLLK